jgi:excisionase family DNA binding protein
MSRRSFPISFEQSIHDIDGRPITLFMGLDDENEDIAIFSLFEQHENSRTEMVIAKINLDTLAALCRDLIHESENRKFKMRLEDRNVSRAEAEQHLSVQGIAEMLGVCEETVRRWIRSKSLHATKANNKCGYVVDIHDLKAFLNRHPRLR